MNRRLFRCGAIAVLSAALACAQEAGQMSEAVVTKWSVMTKH